MAKVYARAVEQQIYEKEKIRVVIRAPRDAQFDEYPYTNKTAANTTITNWAATRLKPLIGDFDAVVIDGYGDIPHGNTQIEKVRNSYCER